MLLKEQGLVDSASYIPIPEYGNDITYYKNDVTYLQRVCAYLCNN